MAIKVYNPAISVLLTRLVNRTQSSTANYASPFKAIDLTPYLGTAGQVVVQKDIHQPAGAFQLSFADRMHPEFLDTVYALCEPMDLVEIRMARQPNLYQGTLLPLVMRGFISTIARDETMGADGPIRTVVITGQDSGKLLGNYRVMFMFETALTGKSYLETFRLAAEVGMEPSVKSVGQFLTEVITQVANPRVATLVQFTSEKIKPFGTGQIDTSVPGQLAPQLWANLDSVSLWQLMENACDRPWNELFIRDAEDGPQIIFRQLPYRSYDTEEFIMTGAKDPGTFSMDIADVIAMRVERSDARVANFMWVPSPETQIESGMLVDAYKIQQGWPLDVEHDANSPKIFGQRMMQAHTLLYPDSQTQPYQLMSSAGQKRKASSGSVGWVQLRAQQLIDLNRDNSLFEEGYMTCKGSEDMLPGLYLELTRGSMVSQMYIESVAHTFAPLVGWTSQVRFCRGTGFKKRSDTASSPFLSEGRKGPYNR